MTKKTNSNGAERKKKSTTEVESVERTGLGDWFDHWPEMLARRWPESLGTMPFSDGIMRLEQFRDDDGSVVVRAELPGMDPDEDIEISVDDGRLTIRGERRERSERSEQGGYRTEFRYGSFERTLRLPAGAQVDRVSAEYDDGILEVRVPVDEDHAATTKISITHR